MQASQSKVRLRLKWRPQMKLMSLQGNQIVQDKPKVRMSRYLDMSSTPQVSQTMVQHRRPSGSSWTKSAWSFTCWILVWKIFFLKKILGLGWEQTTELGMPSRAPKARSILVGTRDDKTLLEQHEASVLCGSHWWHWLILENRRHFLTMNTWDVLDVNASRTKTWLRNSKRCSNRE